MSLATVVAGKNDCYLVMECSTISLRQPKAALVPFFCKLLVAFLAPNITLNSAPFGRWTLRDKAVQRR